MASGLLLRGLVLLLLLLLLPLPLLPLLLLLLVVELSRRELLLPTRSRP